jgi:hypothetical protein
VQQHFVNFCTGGLGPLVAQQVSGFKWMGAKAGAVPSLAGRELTAKAAKQGRDALFCMPNRTECIPLFSVMFLVEQQGVAASWGSASEHGAL